jgi:hypothetical protein
LPRYRFDARQCVRLKPEKQDGAAIAFDVGDRRGSAQGAKMVFLMFPLVAAVTVLLAMDEIANHETRRNRFNAAR